MFIVNFDSFRNEAENLAVVGRFRWVKWRSGYEHCKYQCFIPTHLKPTPRRNFLPHYWNMKSEQ